ncbi:MAG: LPXTG cell wall anchor domain-containing protein [Clostridiales bacterium]|nr:LPXTG cell wall anchor domain-containing protein [Clostridiales bacterium]
MKRKISSLLLVFLFALTPILGLNIKAKAEQEAFSVEVVVNSHDKMLVRDVSSKSNALEALEDVLNKNNIDKKIDEYSWGKEVVKIGSVSKGKFGGYDGWLYAVNRKGTYVDIMTGIDSFTLEAGDKLILYYGDLGTVTVNNIEFSTREENKELTIFLNNTYIDYVTNAPVINPISGLSKVKIDGKEYKVEGNAVKLPEGLSYGNHTLEVSDFQEDKCPVVVADNSILINFSSNKEEEKPGDSDNAGSKDKDIKAEIAYISSYLKANSNDPWAALVLQKLGIKADETFIKENLEIIAEDGLENYSNTDLEKLILNLTALGYTPYNFNGENLIEELFNRSEDTFLINDAAFALIVYNYANVKEEYPLSKEKLINLILEKTINNNGNTGWALSGDTVNPDITGLVLSALAPYNKDEYPQVKDVIQKAVDTLSRLQNDKGYLADNFGIFSESQSFAIIGLVAVGEDPEGPKFTKAQGDLVTALLSFKGTDGQYTHMLEGDNNYMATEQALRALYSLQKYREVGAYDFYASDIKAKELPVFKLDSADKDESKEELPKTGSAMNSYSIIVLGLLVMLLGTLIFKTKRQTENK